MHPDPVLKRQRGPVLGEGEPRDMGEELVEESPVLSGDEGILP